MKPTLVLSNFDSTCLTILKCRVLECTHVVRHETGTARRSGDSVIPVRQRQSLDRVPQASFLRSRGGTSAGSSGPADAGQHAHPLNREFALLRVDRHRLDNLVDPITPGRRSASVLP